MYHFYDELLPPHIWSKASLDKWRKKAEQAAPKLLYMPRVRLLRRDPDAGMAQQFPDSLSVADLQLPLHYSFAPGKAGDGVTAVVPLAALNRLPQARFEWLVPGLLREKCIELLKSLPRPWRKQLVPVPDTVDRLLPLLHPGDEALTSSLAAAIRRLTGLELPASAWCADKLDPYYHMNFSVIDTHGTVIAEGRDMPALVQRLRPRFQREIQREIERADPGRGSTLHRCWDFGELQQSRILGHGAMDVLVYPALVDKTDGVSLEHCDRPGDAAQQTRQGLARLYMFALAQPSKYLKKDFLRGNQVNLQLGQLAERDVLQDDYLLAVFQHQFVAGRSFPADKSEFDAIVQAQRGGLLSLADEYHRVLQQVIAHHHEIRTHLARLDAGSWRYAIDDIGQQLGGLLGEHFLRQVEFEHFSQYPRYLRGIVYRLQKLEGHQQKDRKATAELRPHIERLQQQLGNTYQQLPQVPALVDYRYLLEEYRLSLFAQQIGARKPVSAKRLERAWKLWRQAAVDA
jgi:ATP-dependent helicase HrpA